MKLNLSPNEQAVLYGALCQLDGYDGVTPGVESGAKVVRIPFKLGGPARRIIVKNMAALRAAREVLDETQKSLFKEIWPEKQAWEQIKQADDPENFAKYTAEMQKLTEAKEELEFAALPGAVMYSDANEFPNQALAILEGHGLIAD